MRSTTVSGDGELNAPEENWEEISEKVVALAREGMKITKAMGPDEIACVCKHLEHQQDI